MANIWGYGTTIFKNPGTCKNYISALRVGCRVGNCSTEWDSQRLAQAMRGVRNSGIHDAKPRSRIFRSLLLQLLRHAHAEGDYEEAAIYVLAFWFLFRVNNECLPLEAGTCWESEVHMARLPEQRHSAVWLEQAELVVRLQSRKNRSHGTTLRRGCTCSIAHIGADLCPYHIMVSRLASVPIGGKLFPKWFGLGDARLRQALQRRLTQLGNPNAAAFGLHSFRRGHAHQILMDGGTLADILNGRALVFTSIFIVC